MMEHMRTCVLLQYSNYEKSHYVYIHDIRVGIIEYGSTLYIGSHKVFQLLTYNSKMRRAMRLKSTYRCPKLCELGNSRGFNAHM